MRNEECSAIVGRAEGGYVRSRAALPAREMQDLLSKLQSQVELLVYYTPVFEENLRLQVGAVIRDFLRFAGSVRGLNTMVDLEIQKGFVASCVDKETDSCDSEQSS